ncbi:MULTISPECIES: ABC transporter ATP-binding protein [unclassified Rhizobium]|uniref:ABC transporter ATP-binding protein n=1 Tax=unclassified Rhizobium TaxID=2613769 RepID=UPI001A9980DC|nr:MULTISPECIES: ABC transporter ATP-binding protein [unclassified Rhizobium]MBX5164732.1 ABC transporter ATP-binding protein [Rhizobium sp. NZLR4b]MBX5192281.1 ABC transporter ATP-binding protein [Rhizobium sp. NZLR3b]MBX5205579.1 ABC transporter ATP-binding protein [Rhizobium sp. NZLR1]QSZ24615.1 ABC transporter ATP-binding protein [Rhizobium sp. NZLR1]
MPTPILIIDKLHIGYGDKVVIRDLSLEVHEGEFVALLGASGSGKSSVLRTLAGFHPAMSGRIILEGKDITNEPPERRNVGMVFQNYALFPTMTAFENIAFALRVAKMPQSEIGKRVAQIAETSGITEQLHKKPATMSGGQQQRVAIARALVAGSKVLLFDEPLSNLDAKVRVTMRREIKRLQQEFGFTAVFVTHDQEDALTMSDTIVVLANGGVEQIGDGRTLYREPATPFICEFIGTANELPTPLAGQILGSDVRGRIFVRHEDVLVGKVIPAGLPATVRHVEFLGAHSRIDLDTGGYFISAARMGHELPEIGETVSWTIRPGSVHIFEEADR